jgi:PucR-like helix-turn-helix protein/diguanylate cyclase with GGDEF domain
MAPTAPWPGGVTLEALLRAVSNAFVNLLDAPNGLEVAIASVMLVDADDLANDELTLTGVADLVLHAGVGEAAAVAWFGRIGALAPDRRPQAVMSKTAARSPLLREAARGAGIALIAVHAQTRWESLLSTIRGLLDHSLIRPRSALSSPLPGADTDLFGLAHTVAALTQGMVSIEDDRSRVLAYSASDDAADELRKLSILGREGPADYMRRLHESGVFTRLQRSDDVVEVPADETHGTRRRLVVGIRQGSDSYDSAHPGPSERANLFGTIWVQEGAQPLAPDSAAVLRGASAVAARLITRTLNAPTNEAVQIQRLLGARGGGVDIGSLAAALSIPTTGPAVVIGLRPVDGLPSTVLTDLSSAVRLHASAYARESLVTTIGDRVYVLIPRVTSTAGLASWTAAMIERITTRSRTRVRGALAAPVGSLADVGAARREVDRVLDAAPVDQLVTTLADSRTPVLLGEILDLVAAEEQLRDPRIDALLAYDAKYASTMRESVEAYLQHFGEVRAAAQQLQVHPNTLRYRVRRAEEILDIDLGDPAGRLLVEIQLGVLRRSSG